jgi:hypothetical protein
MNNYWSSVQENLYARQHGLAPIQPQLQFSENNWEVARTHTRRNKFARSKYTNLGKAQRPLKGVERASSPAPIVSYNSNNSTVSMPNTPSVPMSPVEEKRARLRALRRQTESPNRAARRKAMANAATAKIQNWKGGRRQLTRRALAVKRRNNSK